MARLNLNDRLKAQLRPLGIVILGVLALAGAQPFLWGFVSDSATSFQQNSSASRQVSDVQAYLDAAVQERTHQQTLLSELANVVPQDTGTLGLLERLEGLAQQTGVALEVKGIVEEVQLPAGTTAEATAGPVAQPVAQEAAPAPAGSTAAGTELFSLAVSVSATGPADKLLEYIDAVEHTQEMVQVRSVRLSVDQVRLGSPTDLGLTMEVVFYLQRQRDGSAI